MESSTEDLAVFLHRYSNNSSKSNRFSEIEETLSKAEKNAEKYESEYSTSDSVGKDSLSRSEILGERKINGKIYF